MTTAEEIDKRFRDRGHPVELGAEYMIDGKPQEWVCTARGFQPSGDWYAELTWEGPDKKQHHQTVGGAPNSGLRPMLRKL